MVNVKKVALHIEKGKPKDKHWTVYILFFLLGLVYIIPWSFFVTAHEYWMYKFRNPTFDEVDQHDKTALQTKFSPGLTICQHLSAIAFLILNLLSGRRYKAKSKLFVSLVVILTSFILAAVFIHIDTDEWQVVFFALTMFIVAVINAMVAIFGMAVYSEVSHFPTEYLGAYVSGQGMAGIFTASLQVIALAVGISTESSALVYFWLGISVIAITLILTTLVVKYNQFYEYNITRNQIVGNNQMLNLNEVANLSKMIWPSVASVGFSVFLLLAVDPAITSLVVSENAGAGEWNDKYFVPVTAFVLPSVGDCIGRVSAVKAKISANGVWLTAFTALRMVVFLPLLLLCNAQPREHLSVVFPYDYQFILIMTVYSLTGGFVFSMTNLIIPKLVPPEKLESAFHVYMLEAGVLLGLFSFISFVSVEVL